MHVLNFFETLDNPHRCYESAKALNDGLSPKRLYSSASYDKGSTIVDPATSATSPNAAALAPRRTPRGRTKSILTKNE